jgi:hypothetical protein
MAGQRGLSKLLPSNLRAAIINLKQGFDGLGENLCKEEALVAWSDRRLTEVLKLSCSAPTAAGRFFSVLSLSLSNVWYIDIPEGKREIGCHGGGMAAQRVVQP